MADQSVNRIGIQSGGMRTEYVYLKDQKGNTTSQVQRSYSPRASVPSGVPSFLGNREIIFGTWIVAIVLVTWDEWKTNNILPRPLRLWDTSLVYAGLCLLSISDPLVPLANALAIGYTLVLMYQFFTGKGNFGSEGVATA